MHSHYDVILCHMLGQLDILGSESNSHANYKCVWASELRIGLHWTWTRSMFEQSVGKRVNTDFRLRNLCACDCLAAWMDYGDRHRQCV